jgi:hypothetical protein
MKKNKVDGGVDAGRFLLKTGDGRRLFSSEYKSYVLRKTKEIKEAGRGGIALFLRKEGLYSSHLAAWKKQIHEDGPGIRKRGRPSKSREELKREIRDLRQRLVILEKKALEAEQIVRLQMEYVKGAALKLERKDRGLLSELIFRVRSACSVSSLCEALALTRRDFYRTIKPLLDKRAAGEEEKGQESAKS